MVTTRSKTKPAVPPDGRGSDEKDGDKVKGSSGGRQVGEILKQYKKKKPRRKNRMPQSSPLLTLPLEIWNQIGENLDIRDLQSLSYTCHLLNTWLTSRISMRLWKDALHAFLEDTGTTKPDGHLYWYDSRWGRPPPAKRVDLEELSNAFCGLPWFAIYRFFTDTTCFFCKDVKRRLFSSITLDGIVQVCVKCRSTNLSKLSNIKADIEGVPKKFWQALPTTSDYMDPAVGYAFLEYFREFEVQMQWDDQKIQQWLSLGASQQSERYALYSNLQQFKSDRYWYERLYNRTKHDSKLPEFVECWNNEEQTKICLSDITYLGPVLFDILPVGQTLDDKFWPDVKAIIQAEVEPKIQSRQRLIEYLRAEKIMKKLRSLHSRLIDHYEDECPTSVKSTWPTLYEFYLLPAVQQALLSKSKDKVQAAVKLGNMKVGQPGLKDIEAEIMKAQRKLEKQLLRFLCPASKTQKATTVDLVKPDAWVRYGWKPYGISQVLELERVCSVHVSSDDLQDELEVLAPDLADIYVIEAYDVPIVRDLSGFNRSPQACGNARKLLKLLEEKGKVVPETFEQAREFDYRFACFLPEGPNGYNDCVYTDNSMTFEEAVEHSWLTIRQSPVEDDTDDEEEKADVKPHVKKPTHHLHYIKVMD